MQGSNQALKAQLQSLLHWALIPWIAVSASLWPSLFSGLERLQVDAGDTLLNLYFLEHAYKHFTSATILSPDHYWSPDFFWPIHDTLAWSDHLLGQSAIYGIFRIGFNPFQSYVGWLAATLWLNYISIRYACKRISSNTNSFWISLTALITSFSPAIIQQLNHPQLLSLFLIGPILWLCHRLILEKPEDFCIAEWLTLFSWLLANGFFNIYIFVYACYGTLFCILIHIARRIQHKCAIVQQGNHLVRSIATFTSCIALDLAIYIPYLKTLATFGKRPVDEILYNLPKPMSWLFGSSQWLLEPPLTADRIDPSLINGAEQELFPGWGLMFLLSGAFLTAFWRQQRKDTSIKVWLIVLSMMVICSLSISNFSLWPQLTKILPGASSLRASSRVAMMIVLFAAPSIALAANYWRLKQRHSLEGWAALMVMLGGFASICSLHPPSFSLGQWRKEQKALSKAITSSGCDLFWYEWKEQEPWRAQVLAMHAQLDTGVPTANGYSGHFPKEDWPFTRPQGEDALRWITASKPSRFHDLKQNKHLAQWCIVSRVEENADTAMSVRTHDPTKTSRQNGAWIDAPESVVFQSADIAIGKQSGMLYLKSPQGKHPKRWVLMTRDRDGIPAQRGNYQITNAQGVPGNQPPLILITDRNGSEGIEYVWSINATTGEFLSQSFRAIKTK